MSDDETVYVAERICGKKVMNKRTFYLVKWDGYSEAENTWEPLENFKSPVLIHEYDRECREREKERIRLIKIENGDGTPVRASTAKQNSQGKRGSGGGDAGGPLSKRARNSVQAGSGRTEQLRQYIMYLARVALDEKFEDHEPPRSAEGVVEVVHGARAFEAWAQELPEVFRGMWTDAVRRDLSLYCDLTVKRVAEVPTAQCSLCGATGLQHRIGWLVSLSSPVYVCEKLWARVRPKPGSRTPGVPHGMPPSVHYLAGSECAGKVKVHHALLHLKYNLLGSIKAELSSVALSLKKHRRTRDNVINELVLNEGAWWKKWRRHFTLLVETVEDINLEGKKREAWTDIVMKQFPPTIIHKIDSVESIDHLD